MPTLRTIASCNPNRHGVVSLTEEACTDHTGVCYAVSIPTEDGCYQIELFDTFKPAGDCYFNIVKYLMRRPNGGTNA